MGKILFLLKLTVLFKMSHFKRGCYQTTKMSRFPFFFPEPLLIPFYNIENLKHSIEFFMSPISYVYSKFHFIRNKF